MTVKVHLYSQSNAVEIKGVINTYTKDGLYCVMVSLSKVYKQHIFRITEEVEPEASR